MLTDNEKHLMRLIAKDADIDGWAECSIPVFQFVKLLPKELVELRELGARLTDDGKAIVRWTMLPPGAR